MIERAVERNDTLLHHAVMVHLSAGPLPVHAARLLVHLAIFSLPARQQLGGLAGQLRQLPDLPDQLIIESLYLAGEDGVELLPGTWHSALPPPAVQGSNRGHHTAACRQVNPFEIFAFSALTFCGI